MLAALNSGSQLPVIAVFPAGDPYHPIVITGAYSKETLLNALKQAGKSANISHNVSRTGEKTPAR